MSFVTSIQSKIKLIQRRPILVVLIVGTVVIVGNSVLYINKPKAVTAQQEHEVPSSEQPQPTSTTFSVSGTKVKTLPTPLLTELSIPERPPKIFARGYIVIDSRTKGALLAKEADTPKPLASTTKLMTALVAIETLPLDQTVTVPKLHLPSDSSLIDLMPGEIISVRNLLYALMLNSANNAAHTLARVKGSEANFVAAMNAKAKLLGMTNTTYVDPSGYEDGNIGSPRDLARLVEYIVMHHPELQTIMTTPTYTIQSSDGRYIHQLDSSVRLVKGDSGYYLPNTIGGKTGFTYKAGHCLVAAAKGANGTIYSAAVFNTHEDTNEASAKEMHKLLSWALQSK